MIKGAKHSAEYLATKEAAERILCNAGYFKSVSVTWGFCPVTIEGQLTTGHYVTFYARGTWISIEVFADKRRTKSVMAIAQQFDDTDDEVAAEVGAGAMDLSEAAKVLLTRLAPLMHRLAAMQKGTALQMPMYQVTVKDGKRRNQRMEVARACLALGVEVVSIEGPDNSVLITCQPVHAFHVCPAVIKGVVSTVLYEQK